MFVKLYQIWTSTSIFTVYSRGFAIFFSCLFSFTGRRGRDKSHVGLYWTSTVSSRQWRAEEEQLKGAVLQRISRPPPIALESERVIYGSTKKMHFMSPSTWSSCLLHLQLSLLWCISWTHTFGVLDYSWLCLLQGQDTGTRVVVEVALLSTARSYYILEQSRLFSVVPLHCIWLYYPELNCQECELPYIMPF